MASPPPAYSPIRSSSLRSLPPIPLSHTGSLVRKGSRRLPLTPNTPSSFASSSSASSSSGLSRSFSVATTTFSLYCSERSFGDDSDDCWYVSKTLCYSIAPDILHDRLSEGPCSLVRRPHIKRRCRRRPRPLPTIPERYILRPVITISRSQTYPRRAEGRRARPLPVPPLPSSMFPPISPIDSHSRRASQMYCLPFTLDQESSLPRTGIDWDKVMSEMIRSQ